MVNKCIIDTMMITTVKHLQQTQQPTLGKSAYWSVICAPMFNLGNDRSEIRVGFEEGAGYA
jgi:hypothetical protein